MADSRSEICPVCGNTKQGGICLRCRANESSRVRGWRRGDKGGVRPERRQRVNPAPTEPKTSGKPKVRRRVRTRIPPAQKQKKSPLAAYPVKQVTPTGNTFYSNLKGIWFSEQEKIRIYIDTTQSQWFFKLPDDRHLVQTWKLKSKQPFELRFTRQGQEIVAQIDDQGHLMLTGKDKPKPFIHIKEGKKYRLCNKCHWKTEWQHLKCRNCDREFA